MAEVDRGNTFERSLGEIRNQTQQFSSPYAREIVSQCVQMLQTAWNIERGGTHTASTSSKEDEQRRNR